MSLAENLLNSLSTENISEDYSTNQEEHIVVDNTRKITVPAKLRTIAVTGDKDVETVTIDCIRYWDNHDLSTFGIYINYLLPNGKTGTYIPKKITRYDDYFSFDWVIGRNITAYNGGLSFLILTRQTDDESNLLYQWSSLLNSELSISKGLDFVNVNEEELTPDVITSILQSLNSKLSYENISQASGLSTTAVMSQAASSNTFANALKGKSSGAIVALDDVSPLEHTVGVKLSSKNLLPYPYTNTTKTTNGVTFTDNGDGSITINGTATANAFFDLCQNANSLPNGIEIGNTYAMTCQGRAEGVIMVCNYYPKGSSDYVDGKWILSDASPTPYAVKTIPDDMQGIFLCVFVQKDKTVNTTIYPQIELGTVATAYTPYVADDTEVTLKVCGKNLFNGVLTEATAGPVYRRLEMYYAAGVYTISFSNIVYWQAANVQYSGTTHAKTFTFTIPNSGIYYIQFRMDESASTPWDESTLIQVEVGTVATAYEPQDDAITERMTLADSINLESRSPNMTIFTDNVGVVVEAEYNRDSNIVIEKLTQAIISLGGNI